MSLLYTFMPILCIDLPAQLVPYSGDGETL